MNTRRGEGVVLHAVRRQGVDRGGRRSKTTVPSSAAMEYLPWILFGALVAFVVVRQVRMARGRIRGEEARAKVRDGAVLLDVRTPGEYAAGHIEGALNIPVQELGSRIGELSKERPLVVYCRSGMRSHTAVQMLRARGFTAWDLGPLSAWG